MPRNARKAFELFRMGARLNDARCLNNLGTMFEKGYPTPRDAESALRLYRKAANLGNREASANMQRLSFKEGIRAQHISSTPNETRIDNATLRIIRALPISEYAQDRLRRGAIRLVNCAYGRGRRSFGAYAHLKRGQTWSYSREK